MPKLKKPLPDLIVVFLIDAEKYLKEYKHIKQEYSIFSKASHVSISKYRNIVIRCLFTRYRDINKKLLAGFLNISYSTVAVNSTTDNSTIRTVEESEIFSDLLVILDNIIDSYSTYYLVTVVNNKNSYKSVGLLQASDTSSEMLINRFISKLNGKHSNNYQYVSKKKITNEYYESMKNSISSINEYLKQ